jgi:hypothetical protein
MEQGNVNFAVVQDELNNLVSKNSICPMLDEKNSESSNDIELEEFGVSSNSESKIDPVNTVTNIFLERFMDLLLERFLDFLKDADYFITIPIVVSHLIFLVLMMPSQQFSIAP